MLRAMKRLLPLLLLLAAASAARAAWTYGEKLDTYSFTVTDGTWTLKVGGGSNYIVENYAGTDGPTLDLSTMVSDLAAEGHAAGLRTIQNGAFKNFTALESLVLPASCTTISYNAFEGCTSLTNVVAPGVTELGNGAFRNCTALSSIDVPALAKTTLYPFENCGFVRVSLPDSYARMGSSTFKGCAGLVEIRVSPDITALGETAFVDCTSLTTLYADAAMREEGTVWLPSGLTSLGAGVFQSCTSVREYRFPASLESLGKQALRCDSYALPTPRLVWFYGPPVAFPSKDSDRQNVLWAPADPRQTVFVPEDHADAWTNALSAYEPVTAITDADRARADYPTKLEGVKAKATGSRPNLVPARVKESDVLCLSTVGSSDRPYYVVRWREIPCATLVILK